MFCDIILLGEIMNDIKNIIAKNIVDLRKQNGLTQGELAEKLNYSDNTVSRWEHAEITPSVETLAQIAELFSVAVDSLLKEDIVKQNEEETKVNMVKWIATTLLAFSFIWFLAAIIYFYVETFLHYDLWMVFMWSIPLSFLVLLNISYRWKNRIFKFCFLSAIVWSTLTCFYLQFLAYDIWLIYIVGIPVQVALSIWTFVRKK